jgi:hypothetical protein
MIPFLDSSFILLPLPVTQLHPSSFLILPSRMRLYSMLREFVFILLKMVTARRDQREETGSASWPWHKPWHRVENRASWGAATSIGKPRARLSGRERVKGFYFDKREPCPPLSIRKSFG